MESKKYYVVSDIHGFYDELISALNKAGFDPRNKRDILLVLGDIFDRGKQPLQVYEFLKSIPREQRILVRGNHEYLLKELYERQFPYEYDYHNGTMDTIYYINHMLGNEDYIIWRTGEIGKPLSELQAKYLSGHDITPEQFEKYLEERKKVLESFDRSSNRRLKKAMNSKKLKEILEWINSDEWVDYFELDKYIFVHSFIPVKTDKIKYNELGFIEAVNYKYNPEWRIADKNEFEEATWGCPYKLFIDGCFSGELEKNKTLVCGHWHACDFKNVFEGTKYHPNDYFVDVNKIDWNLFYSEHLIALDACTVLSHQVNVLIINETDFKCYDNSGKLLEEHLSKQGREKMEEAYGQTN